MTTKASRRSRSGIPLIAPEDFRRVAIDCMAQEMPRADAKRRYGELVGGASDALARAVECVREEFPDVKLDFSEKSLKKLDKALADREDLSRIIDGIGAYLGETLRVILRGTWLVRFDPTQEHGFRASTLRFDPGVAGQTGFESDVFHAAETAVLRRNGSLHEHYALARRLMDDPRGAKRQVNGSGFRPAVSKRP